jgi:hypothetical protein
MKNSPVERAHGLARARAARARFELDLFRRVPLAALTEPQREIRRDPQTLRLLPGFA